MKKLAVLAIVVLALWITKTQMYDKGRIPGMGGDPDARAARMRVEALLNAWKDGGTTTNAQAQIAIAQWHRGLMHLSDEVELSRASDAFDRWRQSKDLYKAISSYEIGEITVADVEGRRTANVPVTIDGTAYTMAVAKGERIAWVE